MPKSLIMDLTKMPELVRGDGTSLCRVRGSGSAILSPRHRRVLSAAMGCIIGARRPRPPRGEVRRGAAGSGARNRGGLSLWSNLECLTIPVHWGISQYGRTTCTRRAVGGHRTALAARAPEAQGWAAQNPGPKGPCWYSLRPPHRHPLGVPAPGDGVRIRHDLLAAPA